MVRVLSAAGPSSDGLVGQSTRWGQVGVPGQADSRVLLFPKPATLVLTTTPPPPLIQRVGRATQALAGLFLLFAASCVPSYGPEPFPAFRHALRFQAISSTLGTLNKVTDA